MKAKVMMRCDTWIFKCDMRDPKAKLLVGPSDGSGDKDEVMTPTNFTAEDCGQSIEGFKEKIRELAILMCTTNSEECGPKEPCIGMLGDE